MIKKTDLKQSNTETVRLNKYLSDAGVCSRREADRLIESGRVQVDGRAAVMGERISEGQKVFVDGKPVHGSDKLILLALHKPAGIECTTDRSNPDNLIDFLQYPERVFPIGRLDKNSTGLILLTNAGDLSDRILRSTNFHEKEYQVRVDQDITAAFLKAMSEGVTIYIDNEDRTVTTRPCVIKKTGPRTFSIILTQGFNRQIRRMCKALGYRVLSLKRIRVMNILLGDLPVGKYRDVTEEEREELIRQL